MSDTSHLDRGISAEGVAKEQESWLEQKVESSKLTRIKKYLTETSEQFPMEFGDLSDNFQQAVKENRVTVKALVDLLNTVDDHWEIASDVGRFGPQDEILKILREYEVREILVEKGKGVSDYNAEFIGDVHDVGESDEVRNVEEGTVIGFKRRILIGPGFMQRAEPVRFKRT